MKGHQVNNNILLYQISIFSNLLDTRLLFVGDDIHCGHSKLYIVCLCGRFLHGKKMCIHFGTSKHSRYVPPLSTPLHDLIKFNDRAN